MPRTDGYTDGYDTIQGVRTYDSNAGTWTTPDAYEGDVADPASQKSYMWNGNNPSASEDPSGFDVLVDVDTSAALGFGHMELIVYNPRTLDATLLSENTANGRWFHAPERVTIAHVRLSQLPSPSASSHVYIYVSTTVAQDKEIIAGYRYERARANSGAHVYNVLFNNCAEIARKALKKARVQASSSIGMDPNADVFDLISEGFQTVDPADITPKAAGSSDGGTSGQGPTADSVDGGSTPQTSSEAANPNDYDGSVTDDGGVFYIDISATTSVPMSI